MTAADRDAAAHLAARGIHGFGPLPRHGRDAAWTERRKLISEQFPVVDLDAHRWLTDLDTLGDVILGIITAGLADPRHRGPRPRPTTEQTQTEWTRLQAAARTTLPPG